MTSIDVPVDIRATGAVPTRRATVLEALTRNDDIARRANAAADMSSEISTRRRVPTSAAREAVSAASPSREKNGVRFIIQLRDAHALETSLGVFVLSCKAWIGLSISSLSAS